MSGEGYYNEYKYFHAGLVSWTASLQDQKSKGAHNTEKEGLGTSSQEW